MANRRLCVAVFFVFLMLSSQPLDAHRVIVNEEAHTRLSAGFRSQAWRSVSSSRKSATKDAWPWSASCDSLKQRFETKSSRATIRLRDARNTTGHDGFVGMTQTMLDVWAAVRALRRATRMECPWVAESDVDVAALSAAVRENLQDNPCLPAAEGVWAAAQSPNATEAEQQASLFEATRILVSPTCGEDASEQEVEADGTVDSEEADGTVDSEEEEDDGKIAEEDVDQALEELLDVALLPEGAAIPASLVELQDDQPDFGRIINAIWPPPGFSGDRIRTLNRDGSRQSTDRVQGSGPQTTEEWVWHILGIIFWLMLFVLLCFTTVMLLGTVIGMLISLIFWVGGFLLCTATFSCSSLLRTAGRAPLSAMDQAGQRPRRLSPKDERREQEEERTGNLVVLGLCTLGGAGLIAEFGGVTTIAGLVPPSFGGIPR